MQAIARELVETVRRNVTMDWTQKESVKANLRRLGIALVAEIRLSARKAGEGDGDGAGTSGVAV